MSLHHDLLAQSNHLLRKEPRRPRQASLRRSVSTAYYALFHLLIYEASRVFVKDNNTIAMLARSYAHKDMLEGSKKFANGELPGKLHPLNAIYNSGIKKTVIDKIKSIAQTFVDLQQARHEADYNLAKNFTRNQARTFVEQTEKSFTDWETVRKDDLARIYLSCFLVAKAWDKER
jgi:uncharacterized protein (UPF0332 family)